MILINDQEAITRLRQHAIDCKYTIITQDFTAKKSEGNILKVSNDTNKSKDQYTVYAPFSGTSFVASEGTLLETLFDFNLLDEDEKLEQSPVGSADQMKYRSTIIRQPWERVNHY